MNEFLAQKLYGLIYQIAALSTNLVLLVVLIVITVIVLDSLYAFRRKEQNLTGLDNNAVTIGVDGLKQFPARTYVSEIQGLAGRPDALIREEGFLIPVERKPLAKKMRDRYIAQILVYMRLIEEFEGKKPPYGYLILGAKCKKVKIYNTAERQIWLQRMINEMRQILDGAPAIAMPSLQKCRKCSVSAHCNRRATVSAAGNFSATKGPRPKLPIIN